MQRSSDVLQEESDRDQVGHHTPRAREPVVRVVLRPWNVMGDLITVRFLLKYVTRPLHLFGPLGFLSVGSGSAAAAWILATKLLTGAPIFLAHGPLLLLSAVLVQTGIVLLSLGLLAELLTRIYMDGRERRIYTVVQEDRPRATRQVWGGPRPVSVR